MTGAGATGSPSAAIPFAIEIVNVSKRYGEVPALQGVSLEIDSGEFLVLLGPSGCGKSTLLKIIAGLEDATGGEVYINGRLANYLRPRDRDVAMVFQNYALYPHMTVATNIGFPLAMRKVPRAQVETRVREVAALLELTNLLGRLPEELSGGQRQRVALGRAIIREPVAFLMDEPLSNLDALLRVQMRTELLKLHRQVGRTTVYVTHDQIEAMTMADRIVVLRNGLIQQVGATKRIYSHPANTFVATFVGSPPMNLLQGSIESRDGVRLFRGPIEQPLDGIAAGLADGPVTLGIRPEHIGLVGGLDAGGVPGQVELVEEVGSDSFLSVIVGGGATVIVRVTGDSPVRERDRIWMRLPAADMRLFDADGVLAREEAL